MPPSAYSPRWTEPDKKDDKVCDMPDCSNAGNHRAPKSRYSPIAKDYYFFCQSHAGEYNKQWNYFEGMSDMEIEMYWQDLNTDHRPTWERGDPKKFTTAGLYDSFTSKFGDVFGGKGATVDEMAAQIPTVSREVNLALQAMQLKWPVAKAEVKKQFKVLVKMYHPDVNKDATAEDRFKRITEAYAIIMESIDG